MIAPDFCPTFILIFVNVINEDTVNKSDKMELYGNRFTTLKIQWPSNILKTKISAPHVINITGPNKTAFCVP